MSGSPGRRQSPISPPSGGDNRVESVTISDFVAEEGAKHELMESWLVQEVEKGAKLPGLYPPNEENKKRYEEWKKSR